MTLSERSIEKMTEYGIPEYMQGGLIRYFNSRIPPGDFLTAVLSNDLMEAYARADERNTHAMKAYTMWLYNCPPGRPNGWGSREAVDKWLTHNPDGEEQTKQHEQQQGDDDEIQI